MTTIAYRDGVLASDSQCTGSGVIVGEYEKILDLHGFLLGGCGTLNMVNRYFEWFKKTREHEFGNVPITPPDNLETDGDHGYTIILINKATGYTWQLDNGGPAYILTAPFHALGSGMQIAMGAMEMGATAEQAVNAAIKHDAYSGGTVCILSIPNESPLL